ncbi:MAG: thioredoxin domain-containing protein, partial [Campylobacterota bacterium]|nr:thioredoxin domain-containing protein [Campylobacterota bacterium]
MAFIEVDDENFNEIMEEEFSKKNIVLLKFGSEYCDPCQALEFELEELDESSENISILMIECDNA